MANVFISYSRVDEAFARRLATSLSNAGATVWLDLEDIPAGMNWRTAIQEGLDTADLMLVIISPDSMASQNVGHEWQYFMDTKKPIIPILWRPAKLHFQLHSLQWVDFQKQPYDAAFAKLMDELGRSPSKVTPTATPPPPPPKKPIDWTKWGVIAAFLAVLVPTIATVAVPFIERALSENTNDPTQTPTTQVTTVTSAAITPSTEPPTDTPSPTSTLMPTATATVPNPAPTGTGVLTSRQDVLDVLNNWRVSQGLPALQPNETLNETAAAHASYLCRKPTFELETIDPYQDANGQNPQQMSEAMGYGGATEMAVVIADGSASDDDLLNALQARGIDLVVYSAVGAELVKRDATQKVCVVVLVGQG